jgi:hypothetical protein
MSPCQLRFPAEKREGAFIIEGLAVSVLITQPLLIALTVLSYPQSLFLLLVAPCIASAVLLAHILFRFVLACLRYHQAGVVYLLRLVLIQIISPIFLVLATASLYLKLPVILSSLLFVVALASSLPLLYSMRPTWGRYAS